MGSQPSALSQLKAALAKQVSAWSLGVCWHICYHSVSLSLSYYITFEACAGADINTLQAFSE